jgi:ESS family glutamate:Na+ symporter
VVTYHVARVNGWLSAHTAGDLLADEAVEPASPEPVISAGDIDPLTFHVVLVALVYMMTFGLLVGLSSLIGDQPKLIAQLWGFHFLIALGVAVLTRRVLERTSVKDGIRDQTLDRLAGVVVDFTACAAVAAVRVDLLAQYWLPLLTMTIAGASVTVGVCLWLARRGFHDHPFEEVLVMFGAMTGTLPTGLTLLRLADPEMKTPVARNYVMGAGASVLPAIALLGMLPLIVTQPDQQPMWLAILGTYTLVLALLWWKFGGLRLTRPLLQLWPKRPEDA